MDRRSALKAAAGMLFAKTAYGQRVLQQELTKPEYSAAMQRLQQEAKELSDIFTRRTGRSHQFAIDAGTTRGQIARDELAIFNTLDNHYEFHVLSGPAALTPEQEALVAAKAPFEREITRQWRDITILRDMQRRANIINVPSDNPASIIPDPTLGTDYSMVELFTASLPTDARQELMSLAVFDKSYNPTGYRWYSIANKTKPVKDEANIVIVLENAAILDVYYPSFQDLPSAKSEAERMVARAIRPKISRTFQPAEILQMERATDYKDQYIKVALEDVFSMPTDAYLRRLVVNKNTGTTRQAKYAIPDTRSIVGFFNLTLEGKDGKLRVAKLDDFHTIA